MSGSVSHPLLIGLRRDLQFTRTQPTDSGEMVTHALKAVYSRYLPKLGDAVENGSLSFQDAIDGLEECTRYDNLDPEDAFRYLKQRDANREANGHDQTTKPAKPKRFNAVPWNSLELIRTNTDIVRDLLPRRGLCVVWGAPKSGKSFWVLDLVFHVAAGMEYRGRRTLKTSAVYCVLEGREGFRKRLAALAFEYPDARPDLHLLLQSLTLAKDWKVIVNDLRAQNIQPGIIVIDTLNRSIGGSESDDVDMPAYINAASQIEQAFGCLVIIIHHCGLDEKRMRGHTSLRAGIDVQIQVAKATTGNMMFHASVVEAKDMAEGNPIACGLGTVVVGTDDEGHDITTCVVRGIDADTPAQAFADYHNQTVGADKADRATAKWNKSLLRRVLMAMPSTAWREIFPYHNQVQSERGAPLDDVKASFARSYVSDGGKKDSVRTVFPRDVKIFHADGRIGVREVEGVQYIWLGVDKEQSREFAAHTAYNPDDEGQPDQEAENAAAVAFLRHYLKPGPQSYRDINKYACNEGISTRALSAARRILKIQDRQIDRNNSEWRMPFGTVIDLGSGEERDAPWPEGFHPGPPWNTPED
jgi:hypothetical protein